MMEFADIFAYDLNTVIVAGPGRAGALLARGGLAQSCASRVRALDLAPAFGL